MLHIKLRGITKCSSMVANILPTDSSLTLLFGIKRSKFIFFQNMVRLHIKLKGITQCSSMVEKSLPADLSLNLGMGSKGQNSTFSEHGHVTYQIKGNHQMQQHGRKYFARRPLPEPWDWVNRSKFNLFRTWSGNIIKLKGITKCISMVENILPADLSLNLRMGSIGQNIP